MIISPENHRPLLAGTLQNLFYPPARYTYFEQAECVPFLGPNPFAKAAWAADASLLVYDRCALDWMPPAAFAANFQRGGLDCKTIGGTSADWNAHGTQAVFAAGPNFAILSFRGTEREDYKDFLSDIQLLCEPATFHDLAPVTPTPFLTRVATFFRSFAEPCRVHTGFQRALNQVWDAVHTLVAEYRATHPGAEICFTGHSLGAALATLAFSRFDDPDISLYTFGSPRVGNAAFRAHLLANPGKGVFRYVNYNDIITHIPSKSPLYCQTPDSSYRFTPEGDLDTGDDTFRGDLEALRAALATLPNIATIADMQTQCPASLVDHSPARYCFRLWDCVDAAKPNPINFARYRL